MNSWEIIKKECRRETTREGSTGELADVHQAIKVYMALRGKLKDRKTADDAFNADTLVTQALANRRFLEGIGVAL